MKIGIDLDEVLGDLLSSMIAYHNNAYGSSLKKDDFHSYNFWEVWGGTREDAIKIVHDFHETDFFKNIKPVKDSQKSINILKENHELYVITSRQNVVIEATNIWLNKHFPNAFSGVYFGNHFSKNGSARSKKDICDDLGIDLLIDDSPSYAIDCISPARRVFLFDYPWNKSFEHESVSRVYSWDDILKKI